MSKLLLSVLLCVFAFVPALQAQIPAGDAHWQRRSENHDGAKAHTARIDAAIAAYRNAVAASPSNLEPRWKLLRSLRYKGAYAAEGAEQKREVFEEAREASNRALQVIESALRGKGVSSLEKASEKQIAKAASAMPDAAAVFYWDAVSWGEWALVFGKMAAVRQGAADRIRRSATIAMLIDPSLDGGGGARVLGRLHNQTPRVPFLTGWASDKLAVKYLKQSLAVDPTNKLTRVFLAEAMVAEDRDTRPRAIEMLHEVLNSPDDMNFIVEQMSAQEDALVLLKRWGVVEED